MTRRKRRLVSTEKGDWTMVDDRVSGSVLESAADGISTELASEEWADVTA
jgi:hypothetical protein